DDNRENNRTNLVGNMNIKPNPKSRLKLTIIAAAALVTGLIYAASPEEETRFLEAVRHAYSTRDTNAIIALHCWDGVDKQHRDFLENALVINALTDLGVTVKYTTNFHIGLFTNTNNGMAYIPNLMPTKHIEIEYKIDPPYHERMGLTVGEK